MNTFSQRHELVPELASLQNKDEEGGNGDDDGNRRGRKSRKDKRPKDDDGQQVDAEPAEKAPSA